MTDTTQFVPASGPMILLVKVTHYLATLASLAILGYCVYFTVSPITIDGFPNSKTINSGSTDSSERKRINNILVWLPFALMHSIMPRQFYKDTMFKIIPQYAMFERTVYISVTTLCMTYAFSQYSSD